MVCVGFVLESRRKKARCRELENHPGNMDVIANMLNIIVNAQQVGKERVAVPYSSNKQRLAGFLQAKKMIAKVRVQEGGIKKLVLTLKYVDGQPIINRVKRISKPGRRYYVGHKDLPRAGGRPGFYVLSTSGGLKDEVEARKEGLGGELICEIWETR